MLFCFGIAVNILVVITHLLKDLDLAEYLITSKAEKIKSDKKEELKIIVKKTTGTKCPRCWKILEKVCTRCKEAIT